MFTTLAVEDMLTVELKLVALANIFAVEVSIRVFRNTTGLLKLAALANMLAVVESLLAWKSMGWLKLTAPKNMFSIEATFEVSLKLTC